MTAEVCFSCETELPSEAAFCPTCGVSVEGQAALLDPFSPVAGGDDGATRPGPRRGVVAAIGAVIALGLGVAVLGRTGPDPTPESDAVSPAVTLVEDAERDGGTDDSASEPIDGGQEVESADTDVEEESAEQSDQPESVSAADWPPLSIDAASGSGEPVLGRATGQYLFITRAADVIRLDLDTGDTETYRTLARPIAAFNDEILLWTGQGLAAVPAADATVEPRVIYSRPVDGTLRSYLEALSVLDGDRLVFEFALFASGDVGPVKVLVDLSSGESTNIALPPRSSSVGGLVSVPGGGTFDFVEGEFRPVFQGEVVSVGRRSLIGYQCLNPSDCKLILVDRTSGETLPASLPDVPLLTDLFFVDPQDRFLLVVFDRPRLWDLEQGAYVADGFLDALTADGPPRETPAQVTVSPDGGWVASGAFNTVRFLDLESGEERTVELPPSGVRLDTIEQVLFVAQSDSPIDSP